MRTTRRRLGRCFDGALGAAALIGTGCHESSGAEVGTIGQEVITANAVTVNAITVNAITVNAITVNALTVNALTVNALTVNALTVNALTDPAARAFLKYVVSCALPDGTTLALSADGEDYVFHGELGLAPEWGEEGGSCGEDCQRWVSACVLARVNAHGNEVHISVRGPHPALQVTAEELGAYTDREAGFFGNLLASPQELWACVAPSGSGLERTCGGDDDCGVHSVGSCERACRSSGRHAAFRGCQGGSGQIYSQVITTFLHR
ncbi:MAG: hypothetical protein HY698_21350 [Deltaproteobacteria bacterium]|nr:hypothetical protein [Deltaproteobacteria bacterium]